MRLARRVPVMVIFLILTSSLWAANGNPPAGSPMDVVTYHGNSLRTGWFSSETQLTTTNVNSQGFGLLANVPLDGRVDAEPLYLYQAKAGKNTYNVVFVETENNSVYAINADTGAVLWQKNYGTAVPYQYKNNDDNVFPIVGILGTPVIDRTAGIMYFVADVYNGTADGFVLHAVSLLTGQNVATPVLIKLSTKLSNGTTWNFQAKNMLQRPGLLEANGAIYVAFGSTCDCVPQQSRGVIAHYDAKTLAFLGSDVTDTLHLSAPYYLSSIWQSGYGIASDSNGDIYFSTGNSNPAQPSYDKNFNRPDSMIHLSADLTTLIDSFTPSNYYSLDQGDGDVGSGGMMLLPDQPGSTPHLAISGGKDGRAFFMNRDNLGGYNQGGSDNVLQEVNAGGCWCGPAYFVGADGNPYVVTGGSNGVTAWQVQLTGTPQLVQTSTTGSGPLNGLPDNGGSIPVISSNGTAAGSAIVWFVQKPQTSSDNDPGTPVTLRAFDASNLKKQLFSAQAGTFTHAVNSNANVVPTVANGKVYIASNKQLNIFGLLPPAGSAERAALPKGIAVSEPEVVTCPPAEPLQSAVVKGADNHQLFGSVCKVEGSTMQLALRSHRSVSIDITNATAGPKHLSLTPGRNIKVKVSVDANGVAHATRFAPSHIFDAETPADR
jgi:outer membrane protein assembly factor BamB